MTDELPLAQAWAFAAWAVENEPMGGLARASDGYVAHEIADVLQRQKKD